LKHSQTDAAKLWAVRNLLGQDSTLMMGLYGPKRQSDERFQSILQNIKQAWTMGLNEYSEEPYSDYPPGMKVPDSQFLGNVVRNQLKQIQKQMSEQNYDQERVAKVQAIIDLLSQETP
jgi:hypothetical protein